MTNTSIELQKIRDAEESNKNEGKSNSFSNYALESYKLSLVKNQRKVKKK